MRIVLILILGLMVTSCASPSKAPPVVTEKESGGQKAESSTNESVTKPNPPKSKPLGYEVKYTDLVENKCKDIESSEEEEWSVQECEGFGGYKLQVVEGDLRQSINIISPDNAKYELDLWSVVSNGPSTVGDKAEWRVESRDGKPVPTALIVRYNVNADSEDTEKIVSYLTVSKLSPAGACVTAIVPPVKNANEEARRKAALAQKSPCLPTRN